MILEICKADYCYETSFRLFMMISNDTNFTPFTISLLVFTTVFTNL